LTPIKEQMNDQKFFGPWVSCQMLAQRVEEYKNCLSEFQTLNCNQVLNSTFKNFNPSEIQNRVNCLWEYGYGHISSIMGYNLKETVTLLVDMAPEDRLFLDNESNLELLAIQKETKCKIDLKVSPNLAQTIHSSQVSISGPPDGVLRAYLAVRKLLPITVWFDLKLNPALPSIILDPGSNGLQAIQKKYEVGLCVVPIQSSIVQQSGQIHIQIYIRTKKANEQNLKNAIEELNQFIESKHYGHIYPTLQTKIEVPCTQPNIIGRTYSILDPLASKTSTQISVHRTASGIMSNVSISGGTYTSISHARNEISDRFQVELTFEVDLDENGWRLFLESLGPHLERISEETGVHILMKPLQNSQNKRIMIIRGTDKDVEKVFEVRNEIFKLVSQFPSTSTSSLPFRLPLVQ